MSTVARLFGVLLLMTGTVSGQNVTSNPTGTLPAVEKKEPAVGPLSLPHDAEFGTSDWSVETLSPVEMVPLAQGSMDSFLDGNAFSANAATLVLAGHLHLPSGALLNGFDLYLTDSSNTERVYVRLDEIANFGGLTTLATYDSGYAGTPGIVTTYVALPGGDKAIDNTYERYRVLVYIGPNASVFFKGLTFWYKRQISPPPGVATFADVPIGHPLLKFVEALVASGITAGCGGGNYCPNSPLTRGQMAVFLSAALGLHWGAYTPVP